MTRRRALCVVALLAALVEPAWAQQGTSDIRGRVLDQQGASLPGVTVMVRNQDTGMYRTAVSSTDGTYFISGVTPGVYAVTAELQGFKKYERRDVLLQIGNTTSLDIQLEIGAMQEQVTVTAASPVVDVTSKEIGGNITSRDLVSLPSVNGNFIGFIGLLPGIVPNISTESFGADSINVNGQDARNNNYLFDGANNNDDVIGQRAGTQARPAIESIQEFQVLTDQFDAEFGRTTGAVINAVTKQGTNRLHGSAFGYFQGRGLTQQDYFVKQNDLTKPDTQERRWGATIGGPIVADKLHYFFSLERVAINRASTINIPARPDLNASPTTEDRVWNTLVRFDHQINANQTWNLRWLREQSPQKNQIIGSVSLAAAREESDVDQTTVGNWTWVMGNSRVNSVRVNFTRENVAFANPCFNTNGRDQAACQPTLNYLTYTDQQSNVAQARINNAWQADDSLSWFVPNKHGDHDIKFGVQYQYSTDDSDNQGNLNGTFSFASNGPFDPNDPSTYPERLSIRVPGTSHFKLPVHFFSAFAQDKWRMNPKLTLSLGVRYDLEVIPIHEVDNAQFFPDPNKYPVDKNNFSPRLGFSYDVNGDGKSVIRGGYGVFYDKTHLELITGIITNGVFSDSFTATIPSNAADPGPSNGQFPTDPFLVNGPTVDHSLLDQLYPPGSLVKNTGTVVLDNPNRRVPYTQQASVGYERELFPQVSMSADYIHAAGRDQLMEINLNPGLRVNTSRTGRIDRVDPNFVGNVLQPVNTGRTDYDALQLEVNKRFSDNYSARVSYTLSYSRGNTTGNGIPTSSFQLLSDMRLGMNEGPTDFDRRHNLVVSGSALVPHTGGLTLSWVARYLSGLPLSITNSSTDPDQNGVLFDLQPAGDYSGSGTNAITVHTDGRRNGATGPNFFQLDMRFGYRLQPRAQQTVDLFVDLFNLTNRANFDNPSGDMRSTNFLVLTSLRAGAVPRTAQIGVRFGF
jgi:Carboxypeptidase regulatory-like domain/TonB dependent receptor-like, beta-barrel